MQGTQGHSKDLTCLVSPSPASTVCATYEFARGSRPEDGGKKFSIKTLLSRRWQD